LTDRNITFYLSSPSFLIRFIVGYVFILAGVFKWIHHVPISELFTQLSMPYPAYTVLIIGFIEILCGSLILFDMYVNQAAVPLIVIIVGAITLTKMPILSKDGLLMMVMEARIDMIMLLLLLYLCFDTQKAS
jgi:putative oxidoreductase